MADAKRPESPILDVDERKDVKAFYHNVAYKTGRVHINIEKMKVHLWLYSFLRSSSITASHHACVLGADPEGTAAGVRAYRRRELCGPVRSGG